MINTPDYKPLYSTPLLEAGHVFEDVYITNTATGQTQHIGSIYGDPACTVISDNNKWAIIAGHSILIWTPQGIKEITDTALANVYAVRIKETTTVELLIDPWADTAAIWELNALTLERKKVTDFLLYKNKEYTHNIQW